MTPLSLFNGLVALLALGVENDAARQSVSFLVLDLNGDGVYLSDLFYPVQFDTDGDGAPESLSWTARDGTDGFLWFDDNGNGVVDDGTELLFFQMLAMLDAPAGSGDGVLSAADPVWSRLGVWVDRDQNGRSTAEEIRSLEEWNIVEIDLRDRPVGRTDGSLNRMKSVASFTQIDSRTARDRTRHSRNIFEVEFNLVEESP